MTRQDGLQAEGRDRLGAIVADRLLGAPTGGSIDEGPMFSTVGWRVGGRVFAFVGGGGDLIVKLPAERVSAVEASDRGTRMTVGTRAMREWLGVPLDRSDDWADLVVESHAFVGSAPSPGSVRSRS